MMRMLKPLCILLLATLSPLGALCAQAIQLGDGTVLVGEVVDATGEGLSFHRLDNGGLLQLRWDDLSSLSAERIKRLEGLVVENEDELKIEADVITYQLPGGGLEEVVGIARYTPTTLFLKRKSGELPIPRQSLKDLRKREVPPLEVFTPDEWYQHELDDVKPGDDADKQIQLAERLRRSGLYERAEEHLKKAQALGNSKQASQLPAMLARIRQLVESSKERDLLSRIRVMRNRREFDKAAELIAQFEQTYPDSKLKSELRREKKRFESDREAALEDRLATMWDRTVRAVANEKAGEEDVALAAARTWAEEQMAKEVYERLARVLDIKPEEVEELWAKRDQYGDSRAQMYTYGIGSWVLGADKVIAGTKRDETAPAKDQPTTAEDRELERIVRKLREVQQRSKEAQAAKGGKETEEDWWKNASRNARTAWLRAYFAEFGGQMEVTAAYASPCVTCEGRGYIVELAATGKEQKRECPVCHNTKFTRAIRAR